MQSGLRPALPSLPARRVSYFPVSAFASLSYPRVLVRTTSGLHTYPRGSPLSSAPLCTLSSPGSSWMRPYETLGPVWGGGGRLQPRRGGGGEFSASLPLSAERSSEAGLIPFRAWLPSSGWCLGSRELNINA